MKIQFRGVYSLISQTVNPEHQKTRSEGAYVYSGHRKPKGQVPCFDRALILPSRSALLINTLLPQKSALLI